MRIFLRVVYISGSIFGCLGLVSIFLALLVGVFAMMARLSSIASEHWLAERYAPAIGSFLVGLGAVGITLFFSMFALYVLLWKNQSRR